MKMPPIKALNNSRVFETRGVGSRRVTEIGSQVTEIGETPPPPPTTRNPAKLIRGTHLGMEKNTFGVHRNLTFCGPAEPIFANLYVFPLCFGLLPTDHHINSGALNQYHPSLFRLGWTFPIATVARNGGNHATHVACPVGVRR